MGVVMTDKPTTIIAVRHGETAWNVEGRWQGHFNSPLTDKGKAQAEALGEGLDKIDFSHLYSSDLGRTMETATPIAMKKGLKISQDPRLRERGLGIFEGMTMRDIENKYPDEYQFLIKRDPAYVIPKGESILQFYERNLSFLHEIANKNRGKTVVVVTHGGVLGNFIRYILHIPLPAPSRYSIKNASVSVFNSLNGDWKLETWGDVSHLSALAEDHGA
jgi:probable phosphoglycerate mutase